MSDEKDVADAAARDGGDTEQSRGSGGRTAVATQTAARPQRPTGKRSRQRADDAGGAGGDESSAEAGTGKGKAKKGLKSKATKAPKTTRAGGSANPLVFVYNYLKQVVAELRKVIWPNRKQMVSYTTVVLVFLVFMVALISGADLGLARLVSLVFGT